MPSENTSVRWSIAFPARLLRAHVAELALDDACLGAAQSPCGLGDAEVDELHVPVERHDDVLRRHVAVNDGDRRAARVLAGMGVGEPLGDAGKHVEEEAERRGFAGLLGGVEQRPEVFAVDELECDVPLVVDVAEVEATSDVGVLEVRGDARLVFEHPEKLLVFRGVRQDSLERDAGARREVGGQEYLGHSPHADAPIELVWAESFRAIHLGEGTRFALATGDDAGAAVLDEEAAGAGL